jgi:nucleoside-diphosphate-sugar epimerase
MMGLLHTITGIEVIQGDIRDSESVMKATQGCTAVAHLAFINGTKYFYERPKDVLEVGVKGALNTLEASLACNVEEYWLMSSSEVYQTPEILPTPETEGCKIPDPRNPRYSYGGGKLISEIMAFNYGRQRFKKTIVCRPHNVYGPNMGWEHVIPEFICRAAKEYQATHAKIIDFPILGSGKQQRAFCFIDDFTDGCVRAFLRGSDQQIYHVGAPFEATISELATLVCQKIGCEPGLVPTAAPEGETNRRIPDISKVEELGYKPKVTLSEGLDRTIPWYLEEIARKATLQQ